MSSERERRDSRQGHPRRISRLGLPPSASSVSIPALRNAAFETVDELDDLDKPPVLRKVSQISNGTASNTRERRVSRRVSRLPPPGNINPAYDTVDELDDIDRKYRKASMAVNIPSRRSSRITAPGKEEVKPDKEHYFKRKFDKTTRVLLVLAIVFFITTEIMVSVYLMERYKDPPPEVCQTDSCVKLSRVLKTSLNLSADPCTDFYAFACGNFQRLEPYGDRYRNLDDLVSDELILRTYDILSKLRLDDSGAPREDFEKKASQFHHLCMNLNATSAKESLTQLLVNLSWPVLYSAGRGSRSLPGLLKESHQHGIHSLFHVSRLPDPLQPSDPYWTIQEGRLPLPNVVYDNESHRKLYRSFIRDLVAGFRSDIGQVVDPVDETDYRRIVDFEAELADVSHEPVFFKLTIEEFSHAYPSIYRHYDLVQYFQSLAQAGLELNPTSATKPADVSLQTVIILKNRDYFLTLNTELAKRSERDQAVYLGWRILYHYLDLINDDSRFWGTIQRFWKVTGSRRVELQGRWKKCSQLAIDALPDGGLALYRKRYFSAEQSKQIDHILDKLTSTAIELVDKQDWLTDSDKTTAKAKYQQLIRQLPYSEELYSKNVTNHLYSLGTVTYDSFFLTFRTFQRIRQHFVIAGVYSTDIEFTELLNFEFGADYRLEPDNRGLIGVFPRTLVPPFYDNSMPKYAQYSTMGFQYSQELAHVVDYEWFMLNKTGELDSAASKATFAHYRGALGYLLEVYRNTSILLQLPVNSETVYEDSADQAALRLAYRAYQDEIRMANDAVLPGFSHKEFDYPQMFFLTFAQYFCLNTHSSVVKDVSRVGFSHPRLRLTAMVENSEEFDVAFQCDRATTGQQLFDIPDPPRKIKYRKNITAKEIDEWYHWFDRKPGLPTWPKAW